MSSSETQNEAFKKQYYSLPGRKAAVRAYKHSSRMLYAAAGVLALSLISIAADAYSGLAVIVGLSAIVVIAYSAFKLRHAERNVTYSAQSPPGTLADIKSKLDSDDGLKDIFRSTVRSSGGVTLGQRNLLVSEMDYRKGMEKDADVLHKYEALNDIK